MSKKRLDDVAILRSIAILSVVLMHVFNLYMLGIVETPLRPIYIDIFKNWWSFRMPLFVFISSYLFSFLLNERGKYQSTWDFIKLKFERLIIPYIIFATLMVLTLHSAPVSLGWMNIVMGMHTLWFILMLFWCFVLARILASLNIVEKNISVQLLILLIALSASLIGRTVSIEPFLAIDKFIMYFVWFWFGYVVWLQHKNLEKIFKYKYILLLLAGWVICCLIYNPFIEGVWFNNLINLLASVFFILSVYICINKWLIEGTIHSPKIVNNLNQWSYGIYVFHNWILLYFLQTNAFFHGQFMAFANINDVFSPIIIYIFVVLASIAITYLLLKTRPGRFLIG